MLLYAQSFCVLTASRYLCCSNKPLFNGPDAKRFDARLVKLDNLGYGAFGQVDKVVYGSVSLARKRIPRRRGLTIDDLRQEGLTMRKLDHRHVVKLVATYAPRAHELCLLIWPAAVCNLATLLEDVESLRLRERDREDIIERLHALDLTDLSAIEPSSAAQYSETTAKCPLEFLRNVVGCVSRALAHCHANNVRHLDIKPSNILLKADRVYLADFGISRDVSGQDQTTTEGMPGTERWRAPELYGDYGSSMQLSDVYSLGLVFLNIATVLYDVRLNEFDEALSYPSRQTREEQLASREQKLARHLEKLVSHALVTPPFMFTHAGQETVRPRPLTNIIGRMVATQPRQRPSVDKIDDKLSMLGGIHQIYHGECCKRPISWVEDKWDRKFVSLAALDVENERLKKRINELEGRDNTYEQRLESARRLHEQDVSKLQERLREAEQRCSSLEAEKEELKRMAGKGPHRGSTLPKPKRNSSASSIGYTLTKAQSHPTTPSSARPALNPKSQSSQKLASYASTPTTSSVSATATATPTRPHAASVATGQPSPLTRVSSSDFRPQRTPSVTNLTSFRVSGSKLPLPITPNRTSTPTLNRDQSLTDSSMSSSIFSQNSIETAPTPLLNSPAPEQGEWGASSGDRTERPSTPPPRSESPTSTVTTSPQTMVSEVHSQGERVRVPSLLSMKSWAEIAKRDGKRPNRR
jgi:serine/threonine protein kinase